MPIKVTWKSLAGLAAAVAGFVLPYVTSMSHGAGAGATAAGLAVIGLERLADAKDYQTTGPVDVAALSSALSAARTQLAAQARLLAAPAQPPQPPASPSQQTGSTL